MYEKAVEVVRRTAKLYRKYRKEKASSRSWAFSISWREMIPVRKKKMLKPAKPMYA